MLIKRWVYHQIEDKMIIMEPRLLAKISIRVVAIYLVTYGIMQVPAITTAFYYSGNQDAEGINILLFLSFAIFSPLISGIVLWLISDKLSAWVIGNSDSKDSVNNLNSNNLQAVALSIIGLVVVFITLPNLISQIIQLSNNANIIDGNRVFDTNTLSLVIASTLKIVLGVLLVLGPDFWVRLLRFLREYGLREKTSNN